MNGDEAQSLCLVVRTVSRPHMLKQLIESIEEQVDRRFAVVAVNNGGDDQTQSILETWSQQSHLSIHIIREKENRSFLLYEEALRHDFVMFIGDDDLLYPTSTEKIHKLLKSSEGASLVACSSQAVGPNSWKLPEKFVPCGMNSSQAWILGRLLMDSCFVFSATAFRSDVLAQSHFDFNRFDYCVDWLMYLVGLITSHCVTSDEIVLRTRLHKQQGWAKANRDLVQRQVETMLMEFCTSPQYHSYLDKLPLNEAEELLSAMLAYLTTQVPQNARHIAVYGLTLSFLVTSSRSGNAAASVDFQPSSASGRFLRLDRSGVRTTSGHDVAVTAKRPLADLVSYAELLVQFLVTKARGFVSRLVRKKNWRSI